MDSGGDRPDLTPGGFAPPSSAELLAAALGYAARGWPVFPCNPKNKQPLLAADRDGAGKPIRGTGGVKKASTDPALIAHWWSIWPKALVGIACGHPTKPVEVAGSPPHTNPGDPSAWPRLLVLDFDPRTDAETGEVCSLSRLKQETEAQLGCALPESRAVLTPSDGVHLYLLVGDGGPAVGNRGNLPDHVDVRGLGGYVIAPPSVLADGRRYRLHRDCAVAEAPERLLAVLRERKGAALRFGQKVNEPEQRVGRDGAVPAHTTVDDAIRRYALAALDGECQELRATREGMGKHHGRNGQLNVAALKIAGLVAAGALEETLARSCLAAAARDCGLDPDEIEKTIDSGWSAGLSNPRDLGEIAAAARERSARRRDSGSGPSGRRDPSASGAAARPRDADHGGQGFRSGRAATSSPPPMPARALNEGDISRMKRIAEAWLTNRLEADDLTPEGMNRIAWGCGRRIAAGDLDEGLTREKLWQDSEDLGGCDFEEIERSLEQGMLRGFDPGPTLIDLDCGRYPLTDFGLAERFRDRFGRDFRFTTAKGWLGWDGRRWKMLDQDKDTPPAELISAVFETVRLIQREAKRIRDTGVKWKLKAIGKKDVIADDEDPYAHALDYYYWKGKSIVRYSEELAKFGRACEVAGKPTAIAALARRWLTVPIEQFDCEQMAINVMNGTLRFEVEHLPDGKKKGAVRLDPHERDDLITRLAPVDYDREAPAPLFEAMIAWAQPDPAVRRYIRQIGGYGCSGDTGEHLLWFHYGRGRNGKSVTIDSWCSSLGDYSGSIGIESFLDQGIKKRGEAATPDLARLGGVRMLRASEPERGAKLNSALIKMATGGEPMPVRALHRGFFDLLPRFKLLMSGNSKPGIPDTDEGIWGRMRLVVWKRHIEKPDEDPYCDTFPCETWPEKDTHLLDKIKERELAGVFRWLIAGLVDYLEHGFVEPEGVTMATADYRQQSDPLGRFLELCTERDSGSTVKSSELHEVFAAWCKAAGEKEWTPVGFSNALTDKGFTKRRSDGMRWEGLKLTKGASDFVDAEGRVKSNISFAADAPEERAASPPSSPVPRDDDDIPW